MSSLRTTPVPSNVGSKTAVSRGIGNLDYVFDSVGFNIRRVLKIPKNADDVCSQLALPERYNDTRSNVHRAAKMFWDPVGEGLSQRQRNGGFEVLRGCERCCFVSWHFGFDGEMITDGNFFVKRRI